MSDFHQSGFITTLHDLHDCFERQAYQLALEKRLTEYAGRMRICLLLPCLHSELQNEQVLGNILSEIQGTTYIHLVIVALGGAKEVTQFQEAKEYFERLRTPDRDVKVVWVDGPRIQELFQKIAAREIPVGVQGKGQSVWISLGYVFAREDSEVIALHDCDIVTYNRILLGRLIEPTANPNNDFEFCKGFYARISPTERAMKGRVTRIFVMPFVDALKTIMHERGNHELERFFDYHRSFKYPLAGEFSFSARVARGMDFAYDWGLEVATLSQAYHRVIARKIAQIDLMPNYEHKHQDLSPEDAQRGLHRMVVDIAKFYLTYMRSHGFPLDDAFVDMLLHTYYDNALKFIKSFSDDAEVNELAFDRHQEELSARYFRGFLWTAWEQSKGPHESTLIPSWNRVIFSYPEIYSRILSAVEADNA